MIVGDLTRRRGRIEAIEHRADSQVVRAIAPLAEMLGYTRQMLVSLRGNFDCSIHFARYEPASRSGGTDGEGPGVNSDRPRGPRPLIGFTVTEPDAEFE